MGAKRDFFLHGGRLSNDRMAGKIWLTCVACKYRMPVRKGMLDRAARPKCPTCGWEMEPSKASKEKNKKAHDAQAKRGKSSGVIEHDEKAKTGKRRSPGGRRRGK